MKISFSGSLFNRGSLALTGFVVCFILSYCCLWCFDPANFPITKVKLVGEKKYLREDIVEETILQNLEPGFLRVEVAALQQQLLQLPWVKQVDVRKVWPAQLMIQFEEHYPHARWRKNSLISQLGVLFEPDTQLKRFDHLPLLEGPDGKHAMVWQQYLEMKKILVPLNLQITSVALAPRGAWQICLSNGLKILLGTDDIMLRLKRFVSAYQKELSSRTQEIAYVDLRYTSGMAIGWKKN